MYSFHELNHVCACLTLTSDSLASFLGTCTSRCTHNILLRNYLAPATSNYLSKEKKIRHTQTVLFYSACCSFVQTIVTNLLSQDMPSTCHDITSQSAAGGWCLLSTCHVCTGFLEENSPSCGAGALCQYDILFCHTLFPDTVQQVKHYYISAHHICFLLQWPIL